MATEILFKQGEPLAVILKTPGDTLSSAADNRLLGNIWVSWMSDDKVIITEQGTHADLFFDYNDGDKLTIKIEGEQKVNGNYFGLSNVETLRHSL